MPDCNDCKHDYECSSGCPTCEHSFEPKEPPAESEFQKAARACLFAAYKENDDLTKPWDSLEEGNYISIPALRTFWNTALGLAETIAIQSDALGATSRRIAALKAPEKG